jgi:hypothetical protein
MGSVRITSGRLAEANGEGQLCKWWACVAARCTPIVQSRADARREGSRQGDPQIHERKTQLSNTAYISQIMGLL